MDDIETDDDDFSPKPKKERKKDKAEDKLLELLSEGPMSHADIKAEFNRLDICSWRTVEEAKSRLNIKQFWEGDVSYWELEG